MKIIISWKEKKRHGSQEKQTVYSSYAKIFVNESRRDG